MTTVNAIGLGGAETQFISNAQYRAWGALKSRTQGSTTLSLTYNQRLLAKSYSYGGGYVTYEYHNDGSVKFADDQSGFADVKDRAYSYDAAGRLQHAYSGVLARNFVNNATGGTPDGPYDHQYGYDQWGNVLQDAGNFWSRSISTQDSFDASSNRNPLWSYDAAGNILSRNEPGTTEPPFVPARYQYDAAGREVGSTQTRSYIIDSVLWTRVFVNSQTFDGDGQLTYYALRRTQTAINFPPSSVTDAEAYLLRSSVLGGSVITEYKGDGTWSRTHVYAGSERLGQQTAVEGGTSQSILETLDPITGDGVKLLPNGSGMGQTTMDPGGVDVGSSDPFPADGSGDPDGLGDDLGKGVASLMPIEGFGAKCVLDGLEIDCSRIRGDASVQCPNNDCSATITFTERLKGEVVARWTVFAPQGWDPSYDGTYRPDREFDVWRRQGPAPAGRLNNNHASPQNPNYSSAGQLSPCLRDALRQFFPAMKVHGKSYSPVDDARFKSGIPSVLNIIQDNNAVTLGLYDIHFNPAQINLNGGNFDSLDTIVEEVAHTVQFLQIWANSIKAIYIAIDLGGYDAAQGRWVAHYGYHAAKGRGQNGDAYKNDVEKWAKNRKVDILTTLVRDKKLAQQGNICGYDLTNYSLARPDW